MKIVKKLVFVTILAIAGIAPSVIAMMPIASIMPMRSQLAGVDPVYEALVRGLFSQQQRVPGLLSEQRVAVSAQMPENDIMQKLRSVGEMIQGAEAAYGHYQIVRNMFSGAQEGGREHAKYTWSQGKNEHFFDYMHRMWSKSNQLATSIERGGQAVLWLLSKGQFLLGDTQKEISQERAEFEKDLAALQANLTQAHYDAMIAKWHPEAVQERAPYNRSFIQRCGDYFKRIQLTVRRAQARS